MANRFIRVNGRDFSFDEVAKALGVELPENISTHQIQLCQRVTDGVLVAGAAWSETDTYPGIDLELQLPKEKETNPILISRTEQPVLDDGPEDLRTYCYSRYDEYFMYFDVDTRTDEKVDKLTLPPVAVMSGGPYYSVEVAAENPYVEFQAYVAPRPHSRASYDARINDLAEDIVRFQEEYDTYEFKDRVEDREDVLDTTCSLLTSNKTNVIEAYLQEFIEDDHNPEAIAEAKVLLQRIKAVSTGKYAPDRKPALAEQISGAAARASDPNPSNEPEHDH